jgi:hypothetical protein
MNVNPTGSNISDSAKVLIDEETALAAQNCLDKEAESQSQEVIGFA